MAEKLQIQVLFFGACREAATVDEIVCEMAEPATVLTAWEVVKAQHPALAAFERNALFAVNEEHALRSQALKMGDVVAIFPPVSGG